MKSSKKKGRPPLTEGQHKVRALAWLLAWKRKRGWKRKHAAGHP
jgi:hypothetical protein